MVGSIGHFCIVQGRLYFWKRWQCSDERATGQYWCFSASACVMAEAVPVVRRRGRPTQQAASHDIEIGEGTGDQEPTSVPQQTLVAGFDEYSLIGTAKANGLNPQRYLERVFKGLPNVQSVADCEALCPLARSRPRSRNLTRGLNATPCCRAGTRFVRLLHSINPSSGNRERDSRAGTARALRRIEYPACGRLPANQPAP